MSTGMLALLDRAVQGTVALELGDGDHDKDVLAELGFNPRRTRVVAGLKVFSNAARDAEFDPKAAQMTDKLLRYRADRQLVIEKLKRVDIEPVAVLPLTAWERICDATGLYRFTPRGDTVRVSAVKLINKAAQDARAEAKREERKFAGFVALFWGCITLVTFLLALFVGSEWGIGTFFGLLFTCLALMVMAAPPVPTERLREIEVRLIGELVAEYEKNGMLIKELWPNFKEPEKGLDIRIDLPMPPPEVQARLIATERARLPLHVAVVPEAIKFKEPVADVLTKSRHAHWEEVERLAILNRDPIAYVIEGTAVAIIAQYGDFPIEKEVISQVINSDYLA